MVQERTTLKSLSAHKLPSGTKIGYVHLRVNDLDKELRFYSDLLGFHETGREGSTVYLSAKGDRPPHIILSETAHGEVSSSFTTGLFHLAIRLPDRKELAKMFLRLNGKRYPFHGFADHGVSEALYMADPEGNGVEIYYDRPPNEWPYENGRLAMVTEPLDLDGLVADVNPQHEEWKGLHPGSDIGHIHLKVSELAKAGNFYGQALGMDVMQDDFPGALFLSAGGYHHHIGANIWSSRGARPPKEDEPGLAAFALTIPNETGLQDLAQRLEPRYLVQRSGGRMFVEDEDRIKIELVVN